MGVAQSTAALTKVDAPKLPQPPAEYPFSIAPSWQSEAVMDRARLMTWQAEIAQVEFFGRCCEPAAPKPEGVPKNVGKWWGAPIGNVERITTSCCEVVNGRLDDEATEVLKASVDKERKRLARELKTLEASYEEGVEEQKELLFRMRYRRQMLEALNHDLDKVVDYGSETMKEVSQEDWVFKNGKWVEETVKLQKKETLADRLARLKTRAEGVEGAVGEAELPADSRDFFDNAATQLSETLQKVRNGFAESGVTARLQAEELQQQLLKFKEIHAAYEGDVTIKTINPDLGLADESKENMDILAETASRAWTALADTNDELGFGLRVPEDLL